MPLRITYPRWMVCNLYSLFTSKSARIYYRIYRYNCFLFHLENTSKSSSKSWWHSATREECAIAEEKLVSTFVDLKKFKYEARDISIDFDARPTKLIEKENESSLSSSYSSSLSSFTYGFVNLFRCCCKHIIYCTEKLTITNISESTQMFQNVV